MGTAFLGLVASGSRGAGVRRGGTGPAPLATLGVGSGTGSTTGTAGEASPDSEGAFLPFLPPLPCLSPRGPLSTRDHDSSASSPFPVSPRPRPRLAPFPPFTVSVLSCTILGAFSARRLLLLSSSFGEASVLLGGLAGAGISGASGWSVNIVGKGIPAACRAQGWEMDMHAGAWCFSRP